MFQLLSAITSLFRCYTNKVSNQVLTTWQAQRNWVKCFWPDVGTLQHTASKWSIYFFFFLLKIAAKSGKILWFRLIKANMITIRLNFIILWIFRQKVALIDMSPCSIFTAAMWLYTTLKPPNVDTNVARQVPDCYNGRTK